jgi:hypothetical protein
MIKKMLFLQLGASAVLVASAGISWAQCNFDGSLTGAASVVDLQGQGTFSCSDIAGDISQCTDPDPANCTMLAVPNFDFTVGVDGIAWTAKDLNGLPLQVDKIFVSQQGSGARCLYDFEPGQTSGDNLQPTAFKDIVACYDGVDDAIPEEKKEPISTSTNCSGVLPGLQTALTNDDNIITFIGIGTDKTIDADGEYVLAVCSSDSQDQCVDQCRAPTLDSDTSLDFYDGLCTTTTGDEVCLTERPCATSQEIPTGNPNARRYCWEFSHQVILQNDDSNDPNYDPNRTSYTLIPPKEKETGVAYWEQYEGSTCVKVTTTYRGNTYSYWTPSGCPL